MVMKKHHIHHDIFQDSTDEIIIILFLEKIGRKTCLIFESYIHTHDIYCWYDEIHENDVSSFAFLILPTSIEY
jgi:hypothetical protein